MFLGRPELILRMLAVMGAMFLGSIFWSHSTPVAAQTTGGVLRFDRPAEAELAAQETHHWLFNGQTDQMITISVERFPADQETFFDPVITLQAPDGTVIATDDDSGPGRDALLIGMILPEDGLYTVLVESSETYSAGTYRITLVENILPADCESPAGTLIEHDWSYSDIAMEDLRYRIYLPPCYESSRRRYPYVILMHGSNTSDTHWDRLGIDEAINRGVALNRIPPLVVVMPFGGVTANTNVFTEARSYEYVILQELIPAVESQYCLQRTADGRAIGGISRGGFWAFLIGMRNPELFSAVGGHSPFFDQWHAPETHNPLDLATTVEWTNESPRIYIDRGRDDYAQLNIDLMVTRLTENEVPHTFILHPRGQHRDDYWTAHLDAYLDFYTENWQTGTATLPFCDIPGGGLPESNE